MRRSIMVNQTLFFLIAFNANLPPGKNNPRSKTVMRKRLKELMNDHGPLEYMRKYITDEALLNTFSVIFEIELSRSSSLDERQGEVAEAMAECGLELYLESFEPPVLRDVCNYMRLGDTSTTSKQALATAIMKGEEPAKGKRKDLYSKVPSKKKPLQKGITYWEVFHHYTVEELRSYCEENDLPRYGSYRKIINRILAYLEGEEKENNHRKNKEDKKKTLKRKRDAQQSKATKEKRSKKEVPPGTDDEAEHEDVEEEERVEEGEDVEEPGGEKEDEDDEEGETVEDDDEDVEDHVYQKKEVASEQTNKGLDIDLDLDMIETYPLAVLKQYCVEEGNAS